MYDIKNVLDNLKNISNCKSNMELSKNMGVGYDTLKAWIKRKTIGSSFDIIYKFCAENDYSLDYVFNLQNKNKLEQKLDLFSIRTLIALYILIKNVNELEKTKNIIDFTSCINQNFKFATFDLAEDKFALFFDKNNLINEINQHLTDDEIIFITENKKNILSIIDALIEKKENPISKLFDFRKITRKIF